MMCGMVSGLSGGSDDVVDLPGQADRGQYLGDAGGVRAGDHHDVHINQIVEQVRQPVRRVQCECRCGQVRSGQPVGGIDLSRQQARCRGEQLDGFVPVLGGGQIDPPLADRLAFEEEPDAVDHGRRGRGRQLLGTMPGVGQDRQVADVESAIEAEQQSSTYGHRPDGRARTHPPPGLPSNLPPQFRGDCLLAQTRDRDLEPKRSHSSRTITAPMMDPMIPEGWMKPLWESLWKIR